MKCSIGKVFLIVGLALGWVVLIGAAGQGCSPKSGGVGIVDTHLDIRSPEVRNSTKDNPAIVLRDNPEFQGFLAIESTNVKSSSVDSNGALGAYSEFGKWTNLSGFLGFSEHYSAHAEPLNFKNVKIDPSWLQFDFWRAPFLPVDAPLEDLPGDVSWRSRTGDLVHGNVYEVSLSAQVGTGDSTEYLGSEKPIYVKLSEDLAVVPVVIINLRYPGSSDVNVSLDKKNMFDFIPYLKPKNGPAQFSSVSDVSKPNTGSQIISPVRGGTPPDDIFGKCKVQFQVIGAYTLKVDRSLKCSHCNASNSLSCPGSDLFMGSFELKDELRREITKVSGAKMANLIIDDLKPIYIGYFDSSSCGSSGFDLSGWRAKVAFKDANYIEIKTNAKFPNTEAHELGHVVGDFSDYFGQWPGNLMDASDGKYVDLTAAQCQGAHSGAMAFSRRYDEFNLRIGRTVVEHKLALSSTELTCPGCAVTCCNIGGNFSHKTLTECNQVGGSVAAEQGCQVCCKQLDFTGGDVALMAKESCSPSHVISNKAMCEEVCCNDPLAAPVSRYKCEKVIKGTEVTCMLDIPQ